MGSFRTMKSEAQREAQVDKILTLRRDSLIAGRNLARAEYEFHIEFRRRFISKRGMQRLIHIIRCVWVRKRLTSSQANTWEQDILPALEFRQTRDDLISHALLGMDSKSEPIPTKQHKRELAHRLNQLIPFIEAVKHEGEVLSRPGPSFRESLLDNPASIAISHFEPHLEVLERVLSKKSLDESETALFDDLMPRLDAVSWLMIIFDVWLTQRGL